MTDLLWSTLAVESCIARGIDHFFLAPGSRCTPLTLAVARNQAATVTQHFDERGLAFAALGYARASGKPGVFICTSGTAVANAYPAVIEAALDGVPLLLFTADRPPELRGTGANQTIDQQRIFGDYVRWFFDMPCPTEAISHNNATPIDGFVPTKVATAIEKASDGPVHLNWMFREPFGFDDHFEVPRASALRKTAQVTAKVTSVRPAIRELPSGQIQTAGETLIMVGGCAPQEAEQALQLASHLNAPLVTDVTSGLRCLSTDLPSNFDVPAPDTIIHVGGRVVSKSWWEWMARLADTRFVHLTPHDLTINPHQLNINRYVGPLAELPSRIVGNKTSSVFLNAWEAAEETRRTAVSRVLMDANLSEPGIAFALGESLLPGHALFVGNSSPIRDIDSYASWPSSHNIRVAANRGASGIDGLLATGVGFAAGHRCPTTVVLGDLSALHDLNSLALVARSGVPVIVLIVNNHGGGIFDRLPVAKNSKHFEQYFATPHDFGFEHAAAMFGLGYERITELDRFASSYRDLQRIPKTTVIELMTERHVNTQVRQRIAAEIAK